MKSSLMISVAGVRGIVGDSLTPPVLIRFAEAFARGETFDALAQQHQRTRTAIEARLVRLGKIEAPPGLRLRESATAAR